MSNPSTSIEDYLGAIYRLQPDHGEPLPLGELQEYFGFSPISIHEMIQKLVQRGLVDYLPYKGVSLTQTGYSTAAALVRRHRIWECFLSDALQVPIDEAHNLAHDLEHAAPDWITERLFTYIQQPAACPHGNSIREALEQPEGLSFDKAVSGQLLLISRIYPENTVSLQIARENGLLPGAKVRIASKNQNNTSLEIQGKEKILQTETLACFWGMDITNGS